MKQLIRFSKRWLLWFSACLLLFSVAVWYTVPWYYGIPIFFVAVGPPGLLLRKEILDWNYGVCGENGLAWERTDTDSQGGRMYCAGAVTIWLSWISEG